VSGKSAGSAVFGMTKHFTAVRVARNARTSNFRQVETGKGDESMRIRVALGSLIVGLMLVIVAGVSPKQATAANEGQPSDWQRFYYYPYVYYPSNFQKPIQYDHMYYRYPPARQIPVYNTAWHNFYPEPHPWHAGHAFILDVF
jgi:hypothetical protein